MVPILCFDMYVGDTFSMRVNVNADITGWTAQSSLKNELGVEVLMFTTTIETDSVIVSATPVQTAGLTPGTGTWDIQVINPDGDITTVAAGKVKIVDQVTE